MAHHHHVPAIEGRVAETPTPSQVIDSFMEVYHHRKLHYRRLAKQTHDICFRELKSSGIQALVSSREKEESSLRTKIENMNTNRRRVGIASFANSREITDAISDLAGVRIALYVPKQKNITIEGVQSWFKDPVHVPKKGKMKPYTCESCGETIQGQRTCENCRSMSFGNSHPVDHRPESRSDSVQAAEKDGAYDSVFAGYVADHVRVKLFEEQARGDVELYEYWEEDKDQVVEIQIVSVLLHAWAEVEHDITYKRIKAKAGVEEERILDSLNGIMFSAEILLDQLHERIESAGRAFPSKFALAISLDEYVSPLLDENKKNNMELKMLFGLLRVVGMDTDLHLHRFLEGIGFKKDYTANERTDMLRKLDELVYKQKPFCLAAHMCTPYYIMENILSSKLKEAQEGEAQAKARGSQHEDSYRCIVLLSAFFWMTHISRGGNISRPMSDAKFKNEAEKNAFRWPLNAPTRYDILIDHAKAKAADSEEMDVLWKWFERQERDSYFAFVFRIARLGVFASFPDDLAALRREEDS